MIDRRFVRTALIGLCAFLTAGCWDQVPIEERGFVIGVAIDFPRSSAAEETAEKEAPDRPEGRWRFLVTHQFVVPGGLVSGSQQRGVQGSANEAFLNLASEGDSLLEISSELATRSSRIPFYQHLKVLIISEEVAKANHAFADALDFFLRDPELRRSSKVMIAKGDARPVLEISPINEKLPAMYINAVAENIQKNARILPEIWLGECHENLMNEHSFVLPRITSNEKEVKVAGAAVFNGKSNRMVGFLGEEETEGLNFLTDRVKGGMLKAVLDRELVTFNIESASRKIKADIRHKERMRFVYTITCEGVIDETFKPMNYLSKDALKTLQDHLAKEIERMARDTIRKVHKQMKTDVLGLGTYLKQEHPHLWKQLKHDWDYGRNYFASSEIDVKATVYIRNVGEINTTETRSRNEVR